MPNPKISRGVFKSVHARLATRAIQIFDFPEPSLPLANAAINDLVPTNQMS